MAPYNSTDNRYRNIPVFDGMSPAIRKQVEEAQRLRHERNRNAEAQRMKFKRTVQASIIGGVVGVGVFLLLSGVLGFVIC